MVRLSPRSGPPRVVAVTAMLALAAGTAGWGIGSRVASPADAAAARRPPTASLITVAVERRSLSALVTAQASVTYREAVPVTLTGSVAPVDGDLAAGQLVTRAPVAGRTLKEGDVLLEVSGRPVFVLAGDVPMYRTLVEGSIGDDVEQLRSAMRRLLPRGSRPAADGAADASLLDAVGRWYRRRGFEPTGMPAEKQGRLRELEQRVRTSSGSARAAAQAALTAFLRTDGARIFAGEIVFLPRLPVRLAAVTAKAGAVAAGEVATVADPVLVVTGSVTTEDAKLIKTGQRATLTATSGTTYQARVTSLGTAVRSGKKDDPNAALAVPVRLSATTSLSGLAGQSVRADITVGDTGDAVLLVPVAAVFARADGRTHVSVDGAAAGVRDVPVTTGLTAGGFVEVTPESGADLAEGDRVVVSGS
ncbi:hypothetical protein [Actinoplanes sp. NPDC051851]|uniref:HlyD family efflux transporter periplasmic adaptor subunit n=1 Tax=Actinoplanes sp. NPDC051851 TaxID=3154753 RepID=UPI0034386546